MSNKFGWLFAVAAIGGLSYVGGFVTGHSAKVTETTKTVIKKVEVIKEVYPPTVCVDTFKTRQQTMDYDPQCDHPTQQMHVKVMSIPNERPWLEIECKCPHL